VEASLALGGRKTPNGAVWQFDAVCRDGPQIVSANLARRNLTKGQQAMALAMIYSEPEKGRGKKDTAKKDAESSSFSYRRVQQARSVLRHSRDLAESVVKGSLSLDEALDKVDELKEQANSTEAQLARLQTAAPDLVVRWMQTA
jgi:hypothetical protein